MRRTRASGLSATDTLRLGTAGLRARPARAVLSAVGIAIGISAMVAVVGISSSSHARLDQQLGELGTGLLTVQAGRDLLGKQTELPVDAVDRVAGIEGVQEVSSVGRVEANVYRSRLSDPQATGGITPLAAHLDLVDVVGATLRSGSWLNEATGALPAVVVGSKAAERLGVVSPGMQLWMGERLVTVVGVLDPVPLAPELDSSVLVGEEAAAQSFGHRGTPTTVYQRSSDEAVDHVRSVLARTIAPESPNDVEVSRPSDALAAKNAADQAFLGLLVGLGSVALLVGGIGVANTMIISVLERRREIGLRRALGATKGHVRSQFVVEALLVSAFGGALGAAIGSAVTAVVAFANGWPVALPPEAPVAALAATVLIGAAAGLYPALRAARIPPTVALAG